MSEVVGIPLELIRTSDLIRRPRAGRVAAVQASIAEEGLREPLEVARVSGRGNGFILVRGWVRLEALKAIGQAEAPCVVKQGTRTERRWREVDDNLSQGGCTVLDRARYLAAGKALFEAERSGLGHGGARRGEVFQAAKFGDLKSFREVAAQRYGMQSRAVERACTIGERFSPQAADLIAESDWSDHQSGLEQISRLDPEQQLAVAALLTRAEDPVATVAEAIAMVLGAPAAADPGRKAMSAFIGGWSRLGAREKRDALRELQAQGLPDGVRIVFDDEAAP